MGGTMSVRLASEESLNYGKRAIPDVPGTPTIGTATDSFNGGALVSFTPATLGGAATTYTVTSSSGGFTGVGASSPVEIDGLTPGTSYTFTVTASNSTGTSAASSATSSYVATAKQNFYSIATATGNGTGAIYFYNIPQTYTHLQLRVYGRSGNSTSSNLYTNWYKNGTTNTAQADHYLYGSGSTTGTVYHTGLAYVFQNTMFPGTNNALFMGAAIIDVLDYTNASKNKVIRTMGGFDVNGSGGYVTFASGLIVSSYAFDTFFVDTEGSFTTATTVALYGVK
jgi:hypothetical protein